MQLRTHQTGLINLNHNMKQKILDFLKSNKAKTFYWNTAYGFIGILLSLVYIIQPDVVEPTGVLAVAAAISVLQGLSKWINLTYLTK